MAAEAVAVGGIPQAGSLGYLFIYLHGGKHLPKMDPLLGKIDPYARITLVDPNNDSVRKTHKTKTVTQDYSPKWKDKWAKNLKRFSAYPRVEIELWDHDAMSTDDYGGKAIIELASMGFNGTKPLRKARVPISLAPKLKPSGKASQSEFVVTVGLMPDYKYAKWCLDVSGRPYDGDGSKRLFVPLYEELGPGIEAIVEFEGRKCDVFLVQTQTEAATSSGGEHEAGAGVWTELGFYADVDGQRPAYKIRRESLRASDEDTWKLKGRRVETAKKLDDLDMWTPWNRIFLRSYRYELIYQKTQADIHTAYLKPGIDPTIPVSFEELLTQVQGGASFDVKHKTIYYPIPESPAALLHHPHAEGSSPSSSSSSSSPVTSECLALLSSTFGDDYFDRAVWLSASADPSLVVDLTYEDRRKRTEVHFKSPKQVQTHACTMRVSVDDLKPPCRRSQMTARILKKDLASLREVSLTAILPGVFITYDKKKKNKDFITLPY